MNMTLTSNPLDDLINTSGQEYLMPCRLLRLLQPFLLQRIVDANSDEPISRQHASIQMLTSAMADAISVTIAVGPPINANVVYSDVTFTITTYTLFELQFSFTMEGDDIDAMLIPIIDTLADTMSDDPDLSLLEQVQQTLKLDPDKVTFEMSTDMMYNFQWDLFAIQGKDDKDYHEFAIDVA